MSRQMIDSGVEWIGEISDTHPLRKLKYICQVLDQFRSPITADKRSQEGPVLYDYYGASGVIDKIDDYTIDDHVMLIGEDGANLRMRNLPLMYEINGKAWVNNHAHILKPNPETDFYYLFYALESLDINPYITGSAQPKLSQDNLKNILVPFPNIEEQHKIAEFLDQQCSHIDSVLEQTRSNIEEYKKLKQAVITKAVTRGVRGDRPMKDSGIEWIGEIPSDWKCAFAFQIFSQVKCKNVGLVESNLLSLSYGKIIRKSIDTVGGLLPESFDGYNIIEKDDIVLRLTDLQNDHKSLRVGLATERGIITSAYLTLRNTSSIMPEYLYYYLHSFDIAKGFYGMGAGVRQGLNWGELKHLQITVPELDEQREIIDYLSDKCEKIDVLISKKEAFLKEMEIYKKSMIYEHVTGKKEVPTA